MQSIRPVSGLLETQLQRWTQTWRKCPLVTHSLHQQNREGIMSELIVECFFMCPLLCGLFFSAKPLVWEWTINKGCISFIISARQALTLFIQYETEDYYLLKGSTCSTLMPWGPVSFQENRHCLTPDNSHSYPVTIWFLRSLTTPHDWGHCC